VANSCSSRHRHLEKTTTRLLPMVLSKHHQRGRLTHPQGVPAGAIKRAVDKIEMNNP
jgi:hypothetical protein